MDAPRITDEFELSERIYRYQTASAYRMRASRPQDLSACRRS